MLDPETAEADSPFDHHVYAICSDGDLEEGVSAEASSIAGTQQLGNLTMIYDANRISIEGDTDVAFTEDVGARYEAYGWHVQTVDWTNDGTDYVEDVPAALRRGPRRRRGHRPPSLIVLRTVIAWPAPNAQGTGKSHGSALGADEVAATKEILGFDPEQHFEVPTEVHRAHPLARRARQGAAGRLAGALRRLEGRRPRRGRRDLRAHADPRAAHRASPTCSRRFDADPKGVATRKASGAR